MKDIRSIKKGNCMALLKKITLISFIATSGLFLSIKSTAQPYLDIIYLRYSNSPNSGFINHDKNRLKLSYYNAGVNLPIQFKNRKDAIIFSPYFETWSAQVENNMKENYYGIGLPVSLSKTIPHSKWNILLTAIVRMNDSMLNKKTSIQAGGVIIAGYKKNDQLAWKFGVYINNELFGVFIMPLLGIDWRITQRDNLFGVLPGNLTYEHRLSKHFYWGANFRAITNSYEKKVGYWRIDENQLGIYLDTYLTKNIVLNMEAGHSLFRKTRTGVKGVSKYDADVNDNLYFRLSLAYRVRLVK